MHQQTDACMNFIAGSQERKQPFFAWMSWLYPHTPYEASQPFYSLYDGVNLPPPVVEPNGLAQANKPFRQIFHQENNDRILPFSHVYQQRMQRTYCAAISQVDFEIGRILDFLEARGLLENTILLFSSDHGDYQGDHGMFTKSPALYDCLIRVPLICVWPGRWAAGVRSPELVSQVDLMPTLLSAAGISVPAGVQGLDLNPVLRHGKADTPLRDAVFAEYGIPGAPFNRERLERVYPDYKKKPVDVQGNGVTWEANPIALAGRFRMVRTQNWKFIHEPGGTSELYDLRSDPSELVNLWNHPEHQAIEAQLLAKLIAWQNSLPGIEHDQDDLVTPDIAKLGKHTRKKR
jgi:arylsulfatase